MHSAADVVGWLVGWLVTRTYYGPISNLSLISKIIERVVKSHLSLNTLHQTISLIVTSLLILNITPLKQLFCTFMITLSML